MTAAAVSNSYARRIYEWLGGLMEMLDQTRSRMKKRKRRKNQVSNDVFFIGRDSAVSEAPMQTTTPWWSRFQNIVKLRRRASVYPVNSDVLNTPSLEESELMRALRPLIRIGKFVGTFPLSWDNRKMILSLSKPFLLYSLIIAINESFLLCLRLQIFYDYSEGVNKREKLQNLTDFLYIVFILCCSGITLTRIKQLPGFLKRACSIEATLTKYKKREDGLLKHCWMVTGISLLLILLDHLNYVTSVIILSIKEGQSFFRTFAQEYDFDSSFIGDSSGSGAYALLTETLMEVRWIFPDILISVLSMVLARFYRRFNQHVAQTAGTEISPEILEQYRSDHALITRLVEQVDSIISPLTLLSYVSNISYVLLRLYVGLDEGALKANGFATYEVLYTFIFMFARMLLPSLAAANLNYQAHQALRYVNRWETFPVNMQEDEIRLRVLIMNRFTHQVMEPPIGLTGCGYFVITKPFITGLVGAVLTYEIVVLQFQAMDKKG